MDFTREPIIETVITPREGFKLVVRSSKGAGQEEYFVDALEVVSFGNSFFFRSLERPKSFIVPTTDYEVLEVREPRMALKNVGQEKKIKIAGGREAGKVKEPVKEDKEEKKVDKKRERKRGRRRGRGGRNPEEEETQGKAANEPVDLPPPGETSEATMEEIKTTASFVSSLLPPPPTLISEQIQKYKQDDLYKDAFFEEGSSRAAKRKEVVDTDSNESIDTPSEVEASTHESEPDAEPAVASAEEEKSDQ